MYCFGRNYSFISLFISIHPFCVSCTRVRGGGWSPSQLSFINQRWCAVHPAIKFIRQFITGPMYLFILCPFIFMEKTPQKKQSTKHSAQESSSGVRATVTAGAEVIFSLSIFILHFLTSCCQKFMSEGKKMIVIDLFNVEISRREHFEERYNKGQEIRAETLKTF